MFSPIYTKECDLLIKVYDKADDLMGTATVSFDDLLDQTKHDIWKQLDNPLQRPVAGEVHVKVQFSYSQLKFWNEEVDRLQVASWALHSDWQKVNARLGRLKKAMQFRRSSSVMTFSFDSSDAERLGITWTTTGTSPQADGKGLPSSWVVKDVTGQAAELGVLPGDVLLPPELNWCDEDTAATARRRRRGAARRTSRLWKRPVCLTRRHGTYPSR